MISNKEPIATIEYNQVNFRYICSHYDIHLNGTCIYKGELCEFKSTLPDWDDEKDEWETIQTRIYKLTPWEKIKWLWRQWLFEKCVGYHWSYNKNKRITRQFTIRKPEWLYGLLFKFYYGK